MTSVHETRVVSFSRTHDVVAVATAWLGFFRACLKTTDTPDFAPIWEGRGQFVRSFADSAPRSPSHREKASSIARSASNPQCASPFAHLAGVTLFVCPRSALK